MALCELRSTPTKLFHFTCWPRLMLGVYTACVSPICRQSDILGMHHASYTMWLSCDQIEHKLRLSVLSCCLSCVLFADKAVLI